MARRLAAGAVLLAALAACAPELPTLARVGEVSGTAVGAGSKPRAYSTGELKGRVWLVDFVYSMCGGPCPMITGRFGALQRELPNEIGLLSVTVDPRNDTPARLTEYAESAGAEPGRWLFLRLEPEVLETFVMRDLKLPYAYDAKRPPKDRVIHSTMIALVDAGGAVRGYYDSTDDAAVERLRADARRLAKAAPRG